MNLEQFENAEPFSNEELLKNFFSKTKVFRAVKDNDGAAKEDSTDDLLF